VRSMQRSMCAAILSLESVVMLLTTPVMVSLSDVEWPVAVAIGGGLTVLCILVAGMLRRPSAYVLGWLIQAAAVGLGFVIPAMFVLGAIFLALWWAAYAVGARVDQEKAAYNEQSGQQ
jgi:hypothetical protein